MRSIFRPSACAAKSARVWKKCRSFLTSSGTFSLFATAAIASWTRHSPASVMINRSGDSSATARANSSASV